MAKYSAFLGRKVEVLYRACDILLTASGTFVGDSGRCIFLEQHFLQKGLQKNFRWEIPYQYVVRLEEKGDSPAQDPKAGAPDERVVSSGPAPKPAPAALSLPKPTQNRLIL